MDQVVEAGGPDPVDAGVGDARGEHGAGHPQGDECRGRAAATVISGRRGA